MTILSHYLKGRRALAAAAVLALCNAGDLLAQNRDLTVEQESIADIGEGPRAQSSNIKVAAWVDRQDGVYRPGDSLTLQVKANRSAYITVVDVGTSGRVHVVFPNKYQRNNHVQAHEVVQIPEEGARVRFTVNGPSGREVLKVFATERPIDYFDVHRLAEAGAYYSVPGDARSIARDLSVELNDTRRAEYGVATKVVRILGQSGDLGDFGNGQAPVSYSGSAEQLFKLGEAAYYSENGGSIRAALGYYTQAAEAGHVLAMVRLGQIYEEGAGGEPQMSKAIAWYQKAAELGATQAMVKLARLYGTGQGGVAPDFTEALTWLHKAAKAGDGIAMARLAKAYDEGRGVARNPEEAAHYSLGAVRAGAWSVQNDMPRFSQQTREEMQRLLKEAGYYHGAIDGVFGDETRAALTDYARSA